MLKDIPFVIFYTDPLHGDLLPINNDENLAKAISSAKPFLRLILQRKGLFADCRINFSSLLMNDAAGEGWEHLSMIRGKKNAFFGISSLLPISSVSPHKNRLSIGHPEDFRQVSQIIDVDILPDTCRRVRLVKHGSDKPLGFYIRDGTSVRVTPQGLEKGPGIFISRLVPGGLAEGTGLLAVNDEVLEVNGIEVSGKTLDQVTDMMVANSSNLIITIHPAKQRNLPLAPAAPGMANSAFRSSGSRGSRNSSNSDDEDEDEVRDHLLTNNNGTSASTHSSKNESESCHWKKHDEIDSVRRNGKIPDLKSESSAQLVSSHEEEHVDDVVTL